MKRNKITVNSVVITLGMLKKRRIITKINQTSLQEGRSSKLRSKNSEERHVSTY
jgi:hypothetical protein